MLSCRCIGQLYSEPVLSGHLELDKKMVLMDNGS